MVSSVNSHTNATRIGWHMWEIVLRFAPGLPPEWTLRHALGWRTAQAHFEQLLTPPLPGSHEPEEPNPSASQLTPSSRRAASAAVPSCSRDSCNAQVLPFQLSRGQGGCLHASVASVGRRVIDELHLGWKEVVRHGLDDRCVDRATCSLPCQRPAELAADSSATSFSRSWWGTHGRRSLRTP